MARILARVTIAPVRHKDACGRHIELIGQRGIDRGRFAEVEFVGFGGESFAGFAGGGDGGGERSLTVASRIGLGEFRVGFEPEFFCWGD